MVELSPELRKFVEDELAKGNYSSEQAIVERAILLLRQLKLHALRREMEVGLEALEQGDAVAIEGRGQLQAFFDHVIARGEIRAHSNNDGA